jgi:hypothetical protein
MRSALGPHVINAVPLFESFKLSLNPRILRKRKLGASRTTQILKQLFLHVFSMDFLLQELSLRQHLDGHCIWWPVAGGRWPVGLWLVVAGTNRTCSIDPLINLSLIEFLGAIPAGRGSHGSFSELSRSFRGFSGRIFGSHLYRNVRIYRMRKLSKHI